MAEERLQKILARAGVASRRKAEELITAGRVRVNGRVVSELGAKADAKKSDIELDGKRLEPEQRCYGIFHKPRGMVTTRSVSSPSANFSLSPSHTLTSEMGSLAP